MKTENNLQNKAAFFAQYWGQSDILCHPEYKDEEFRQVVDSITIDWLYRGHCGDTNYYLELYSLEDITDEDKQWLLNHTDEAIYADYKHLWKWTFAADYLRSKGYLIGFRDLTAEDLLQYGWAKIKKR